MNHQELKFAYILTSIISSNTFIGAILVSDYKGFPLEFKYTDPVVPTKIQQVLYGNELENYIKLDVIFDNLINSVTDSEAIKYIYVQDDYLLNNASVKQPVIRLTNTKTTALEDKYTKVKDNEYLIQTSCVTTPLRVQTAANVKNTEVNDILDTIINIGSFIDVSEPFERVSKTLDLVVND